MKILIVDDDRDLTDLLGFVLQRAAFRAVVAHDSAAGLELLDIERPSLVLLDARIGSASGFDLLKEIRRSSQIPVIMLTAMAREDDKVLAFQLGADDYITKPFSHRELIARIRARLRISNTASTTPVAGIELQLGSLTLNAQDYSAAKGGKALKLTATEFRLLYTLLARAGTVVPTGTLVKEIWGYDDPSVRDSLRVTVYRVRRKIEDDPSSPRLLQTVQGVGFVLKAEMQERSSGVSEDFAEPREDGTGPEETSVVPGRSRPRGKRARSASPSATARPPLQVVPSSSLDRRLAP